MILLSANKQLCNKIHISFSVFTSRLYQANAIPWHQGLCAIVDLKISKISLQWKTGMYANNFQWHKNLLQYHLRNWGKICYLVNWIIYGNEYFLEFVFFDKHFGVKFIGFFRFFRINNITNWALKSNIPSLCVARLLSSLVERLDSTFLEERNVSDNIRNISFNISLETVKKRSVILTY